MTFSGKNMREFMNITEDRKDHSDIIYSNETNGSGEITGIVANLKNIESGKYTNLGRKLQKIQKLKEEISELEKETKADTKELISDLFDAEDAAFKRTIDTVSFVFELTKNPKPTETYKYGKILEELEKKLTPELILVLHELKTKHRSTIQKSPALRTLDKADYKSESVNEGISDKFKSFFAKLKNWVLSWGKKYDAQLNALKDEARDLD